MKKIPRPILIGLLLVTAFLAYLNLRNVPQRFSPTNELIGENLIDPFGTTDLTEVRIADAENEVILRKNGAAWVVANRQNYPIDSIQEINHLIDSIALFRVGLEIRSEDSHHAEMGLLAPSAKKQAEAYQEQRKSEGEENPTDPRGLLISMKGSGEKVFANMILGQTFGDNPGERYRGIVLRSLSGHKGVWKILGTLTRRTGEAAAGATEVRRGQLSSPKAWLSYKFLEIQNIKSISLSAPNDKEFKAWSVTRETDQGDFTTGDLKEDEEMDTGTTGSFKTLFGKLRFEDVLDPAEAEKKKDSANARQAIITTFDNFTYTFDLTPMKAEAEEKENDNSPPLPSSNYIGTVNISAKFPATRDKDENETEEQAKAQDQLFTAKQENLNYKLEQEKGYESHTYEFAQFSISSLNKARDEIVKAKAPPSPEGSTPPTALPNGFPPAGGILPGTPSAVTPPVRVPPIPPKENP
jgi:hypothetical protein